MIPLKKSCDKYYCGRFINRHMVDHSMSSYHLLAMSLSDLSFWCYVCDCYIIDTNPKLLPIYASAHLLKFNCPCPHWCLFFILGLSNVLFLCNYFSFSVQIGWILSAEDFSNRSQDVEQFLMECTILKYLWIIDRYIDIFKYL